MDLDFDQRLLESPKRHYMPLMDSPIPSMKLHKIKLESDQDSRPNYQVDRKLETREHIHHQNDAVSQT